MNKKTIQERIEKVVDNISACTINAHNDEDRNTERLSKYRDKAISQLNALLEQALKEQRELCAEEFHGSSGMIIEKILNAPSPLKEKQ